MTFSIDLSRNERLEWTYTVFEKRLKFMGALSAQRVMPTWMMVEHGAILVCTSSNISSDISMHCLCRYLLSPVPMMKLSYFALTSRLAFLAGDH